MYVLLKHESLIGLYSHLPSIIPSIFYGNLWLIYSSIETARLNLQFQFSISTAA